MLYFILEPALCPNNCSGNGVCSNGLCLCTAPWSGGDCTKCMRTKQERRIERTCTNSCDLDNQQIMTKPSNSSPEVTVQTEQETVTFTVSVRQIREISSSGALVKQVHITFSFISFICFVFNMIIEYSPSLPHLLLHFIYSVIIIYYRICTLSSHSGYSLVSILIYTTVHFAK